ncbi:hypothetical protein [Pelagovum pacificum]|uniref:Uncharacterized protein n=1 Tax=Pelagovum pacificum TaxID=2588711 RepID=A0A5C5GBG4_9RHOB|nr:hypothetical protein [Pelagovum pacificum]QQA42213.1 hypothetical protein I8N54_15665 [Pelagovum pacificum]TNY31300.1 hypothetical protein FHY64_14855 [Pelagovum pacificum]
MRKFLLSLGLALLALPAAAQQNIGGYYAYIGAADLYNSSGTRLTSPGAILQQDRANFHRYGVRQQWDSADPWFGSQGHRASLPSLYADGPKYSGIAQQIVNGDGYFYIQVFAWGDGQMAYITVSQGAG